MSDDRRAAESAALAVAAELSRCVLAGDTEGLRRVYSPDATVWQNFVEHERTVEEVVSGVEHLRSVVNGLSYGDVTIHPTPTGYVEQHSLEGAIRDTGERFSHPVCLVTTVRDGKIVRIEEYGDIRTIEPVARALARLSAAGSSVEAASDSGPTALDASRDIETLLVAYARNLDANTPEGVRDVFTADCVVRYPGMDVIEGVDEVIDTLREAHRPLSATCHSLSNVQIVVGEDGNTAQASSYLNAWHKLHEDGSEFVLLGRYDDELTRSDQGWRIAERRLLVFKTDFDVRLADEDRVPRVR